MQKIKRRGITFANFKYYPVSRNPAGYIEKGFSKTIKDLEH